MSELNPNLQIKTINVGVRTLREVKVYPLSMSDQFALPDTIIEAVTKFGKLDYKTQLQNALVKASIADDSKVAEGEDEADPTEKDAMTVKIVIELIEENIEYILGKVTDDVTLDDLTNDQFSELIDIVFTVNYEGAVGKVKDLVNRAIQLFKPAKA
jgi:hypothetical protein